jgi:hypothetical protein
VNPRRAALLCVLLLAGMAGARAQPLGAARDSAVKAAYLYKFGSFVEWPPGTFRGPNDPFVIGVWGDDAVASELTQLAHGRDIEGHPVKVLRLREAEDAHGLQILYAGGARESRIRDVLATRGRCCTTQEDGRVRFNASLPAAAARNLKLSAKLLAVALQVEGR